MRGKVTLLVFFAEHRQDHPRLCGEKFPFCLPYDAYQGSPPPMRGKVFLELVQVTFDRITPAYAGKRCATTVVHIIRQDHPRLCGEKQTIFHFQRRYRGSPPPMRGKE